MQTTLSCFVCIWRSHCSNSLCLSCTSVCVCVYFLFLFLFLLLLLFSFEIRDSGLDRPGLPDSIKVLCVCELSSWNSSVAVACSRRRGGQAGLLKIKLVIFHCFHICTKKKKKDISNWNFYICPLCCLQPTVMLQMIKPVEKSCFWLCLLKRREDLPTSLLQTCTGGLCIPALF